MSRRSATRHQLAEVANACASVAEDATLSLYAGHAWPWKPSSKAQAQAPLVTSLVNALAPVTAYVTAHGDREVHSLLMEHLTIAFPKPTLSVLQHVHNVSDAFVSSVRKSLKASSNPGKNAPALPDDQEEITKEVKAAFVHAMDYHMRTLPSRYYNIYTHKFDRASHYLTQAGLL